MIQAFRFLRRSGTESFCTKAHFDPHYGDMAILKGLSDGTIINGELVVSHYNNARGRIITDKKERFDCSGFINRNRALSGDRVYARILTSSVLGDGQAPELLAAPNPKGLDEGSIEPLSCKVVGIDSRRDQRIVARARAKEELIQPRDVRFPAMKIQPALNSSALVLVKVSDWPETQVCPNTETLRVLGPEGSPNAEDDASLEMSGMLSERYSSEVDSELRAKFSPDEVISKELLTRRDCRSSLRVFTIDPPNAKDLDDAISVSRVPGSVLVGVHVADVSYFLEQGSATDTAARQRATSVYLPRQVYPMLPPYLSENLCSLLPNEDRLAFSVFFHLNEKSGEISGQPEFVRTVIRSSAQLSYDQVDQGDVPPAIAEDIQLLTLVCRALKKNRIDVGAVCIDDRSGEEMHFEFHQEFPIRVFSHKGGSSSSHSLIEELMVMTNKLVAQQLAQNAHKSVPIVRRHMETEQAVLDKGIAFLSQFVDGLDEVKNVSTLLQIGRENLSPVLYSTLIHSVLTEFSQAEYWLDSSKSEPLFHWGVGAERYMHFTSPIRRYADVIVHRKLAGFADQDETEQIEICNRNSRLAAEAEKTNKLFYFTTFVKSFGQAGFPIDAVVHELIDGPGKPSVVLYLPILGELKSQSIESLGVSIDMQLLSVVKVRVIVKNPPKFYLRMDPVPSPPS